MGNVIDISHRFRDKKNKQLDPVISDKIDELKSWFYEQWPEAELTVNFIFSRVVGEELELRRQLTYKNRNTKHTVICSTVIHRHTWTSPYLMYKFLDKFVEEKKKSITAIMNLSTKTFDRKHKEIVNAV